MTLMKLSLGLQILQISLQIFLNIYEYIWWLLHSEFLFIDKRWIKINLNHSSAYMPDMETTPKL